MLNKKKIRVEFFEDRSGEGLGYSELKLKEIPDSWKWETEVIIDGKSWELVRVDPESKKQIKKEKWMRAFVRRADGGNDHEIDVENTLVEGGEENLDISVEQALSIPISEDSTTLVPDPETSEEVLEENSDGLESDDDESSSKDLLMASGAVEALIQDADLPQDPQEDINYTFPTVAGDDPDLNPDGFSETPFQIHPDLWRQMEWIPVDKRPWVESAFGSIRVVMEKHSFYREGARYYRDCYHRTEGSPLSASGLKTEALLHKYFSDAKEFSGVELSGKGLVRDGFALELSSGIILYGIAPFGEVQVLALEGADSFPEEALSTDLDLILVMMNDFRLEIVDWLDILRLGPAKEQLSAFFKGAPLPDA